MTRHVIAEKYLRIARALCDGISQYQALRSAGYKESTCKSFAMLYNNCPSLRAAINQEYEMRLKNLPPPRRKPLRKALVQRLEYPNLVNRRKQKAEDCPLPCPGCGRKVGRRQMYLSQAGTGYLCAKCAGI